MLLNTRKKALIGLRTTGPWKTTEYNVQIGPKSTKDVDASELSLWIFSPLAVSCAWTWAHKLYLKCRWPSKIQSHLMDTMFSFACFTLSRTISNSRGRNKSISIFRRMRFNCATSLELSFSLKMSDICSNGSWKRVEDLLNLLLFTTLNGQRQETCNNIHETILRKVVY